MAAGGVRLAAGFGRLSAENGRLGARDHVLGDISFHLGACQAEAGAEGGVEVFSGDWLIERRTRDDSTEGVEVDHIARWGGAEPGGPGDCRAGFRRDLCDERFRLHDDPRTAAARTLRGTVVDFPHEGFVH